MRISDWSSDACSSDLLERMFSHPRNKVDVFEALGSGKIVLINTAKDLLKQEECAIFGRFFIALIAQAVLQRAALLPHERRPAFVHLEQAQGIGRAAWRERVCQYVWVSGGALTL